MKSYTRRLLVQAIGLCLTVSSVVAGVSNPGRDKAAQLFKEGLTLRRAGAVVEATARFNAAIMADSTYGAAWSELADIYFAEGDFTLSLYHSLVARNHGSTAATGQAGLSYYRLKQYDNALELLSLAAADSLATTNVIFSLAGVYARQEHYRESIYYYERGITESVVVADDSQKKNVSDSVLLSQIARDTAEPKILYCLAQAAQRKGYHKAAAGIWQLLLRVQPANGFAMFMMGKAYMDMGEMVLGEKICDQAQELGEIQN
ncbi:hypothetical protein SAMN05444266_104497 [Chitinophaga jiangningensis]|uniref:Tetratricopeptide repeat-containing protein n=1 Tax=Chitinophaga jiangningensis TaxID=1419482 RepID=A0A1M7CVQ7_9BACT|nr:hypothetical protein [Chitinophaga jiangningensis]SHL71305.1 hypothetical protein SAMN05444266_104497 [Chitinophaga jiangningensis]